MLKRKGPMLILLTFSDFNALKSGNAGMHITFTGRTVSLVRPDRAI